MGELARSRNVQVIQTRQPEAQCSCTEQRSPQFSLVGSQRPRFVVRADERPDALRVEMTGTRSIGLKAPVVDSDREIVGERIGRRKTEIDNAGKFLPDEEHVVAKKIAVDRRPRQLSLGESSLVLELRGDQR